jgi:general stress protein 26
MADLKMAHEEPLHQFWKELHKAEAGMLGIEGSGQHMQPMAPHADPANNKIWFFARRDSDLVKALNDGARAQMCLVGRDQDYHACVGGTLSEKREREKIEEYWSPVIAAWFSGGKDDPDLTLLELKLQDGIIWASSNNPIKFGWEIAKGNLGFGDPDVGVRNHLKFA